MFRSVLIRTGRTFTTVFLRIWRDSKADFPVCPWLLNEPSLLPVIPNLYCLRPLFWLPALSSHRFDLLGDLPGYHLNGQDFKWYRWSSLSSCPSGRRNSGAQSVDFLLGIGYRSVQLRILSSYKFEPSNHFPASLRTVTEHFLHLRDLALALP